jgi:RNA polymerase sigma factor (TIGR02999 family)
MDQQTLNPPATRFDARASATPPPELLAVLRSRSGEALDHLVPLLYRELRDVAHRARAARGKRRPGDSTFTTTALVNEVYLKLVDQTRANWTDRAHFLAIAAVAVRHILVDRAKARIARKRGGDRVRVPLDEERLEVDHDAAEVLEIHEALNALAELEPRLARVVEYRFFGGLSEEEIAASLDVTVRTVQRDWAKARLLLQRELSR